MTVGLRRGVVKIPGALPSGTNRLAGGARRGRADYEPGGKCHVQGLELVAVDKPDQLADCHPAQFPERLMNRRERGISGFGFRRVVETDDRQVIGKPESS